jgi:hypothetical protein
MKRQVILFLLAVVLVLALGGVVFAQTGGGYDLTWNTVDGGGYTFSSGAGYSLGGTAGQADAGRLSGGGYTLNGGFWRGGVVVGSIYKLYLPCILHRQS